MAKHKVFFAVLAAGSSRRFGEEDKLAQPFRGQRLGQHVCRNAPVDWVPGARAFVIASSLDHPCQPAWLDAGFRVAMNPQAAEGMGNSVANAARRAIKMDCNALLIALADMPFVPRQHFEALIEAWSEPDDIICSAAGRLRSPPAIFGRNRIDDLTTLTGDTGARALLKEARTLECPPEWLVDIDTPEALARYA